MRKFGDAIVGRARSLVGTRFRPQGREPATGLDCVGLLLCVFDLPDGEVRHDYRLRGFYRRELETELFRFFRRVSATERRCGDVLLCAVAPNQMHLAINCGVSFVHADARLRKVVETPGGPGWPVLANFRRRTIKRRSS